MNSSLRTLVHAKLSSALTTIAGLIFLVWIYWIFTSVGRSYAGMLLVGVTGCIVLLRWPSSPISVLYPALWICSVYQIAFIGGQPERIVGALGIAGMVISMGRFGSRFEVMPSFIGWGLFLLLGAHLLSWAVHPLAPRAMEYSISLAARVVFFYLVCFHLRTRQQLRSVLVLFVAAGLASGALTFWASMEYGFGFIRNSDSALAASQRLGPFLTSVVAASGLNSVPGLFVLAFYRQARPGFQRVLILAASFFLFSISFVAQYRRELLISIPLVLLLLSFPRRSGLRRPALLILSLSVVVFLSVLMPTQLVQRRMTDTFQEPDSGIETRVMTLEAGALAFLESPLFGYGPGTFEEAVLPILRPGLDPWRYHPYNVFVWVAVETGLLGLVGVLLVLFGLYRQMDRVRYSPSGIEGAVLQLAPALLLQIVIWFSFGNAWLVSLPWYVMGVVISAARIARAENYSVQS